MKHYINRSAFFAQLNMLENRTLLAGIDLDHDNDHEGDDHEKDVKKKKSSILSKISHKAEKIFGHHDKKVVEKAPVPEEPAENLTHHWLKLLGAYPKEGGSIDHIMDAITSADKSLTDNISKVIEKFSHLMDPTSNEGILEVAHHLLEHPEAKVAMLKALEMLEQNPTIHAFTEKLRNLPNTAEAWVDFIGELMQDQSVLKDWIDHLMAGHESLQEMAVHSSEALSHVLAQNGDIMELIHHLAKNPKLEKHPETVAFIEHLTETLEQGSTALGSYLTLSPKDHAEHVANLSGLGDEVMSFLESHADSLKITVENAPSESTSEAKLGVDSTKLVEEGVKKHKTKNPVKKIVHFTEKKVIKLAHGVEKKLSKIEKGLIKIFDTAEERAIKIKNHLKKFAKSEDKLKFIADDIQKSVKKIGHTAKKIATELNLTNKESRSHWEDRLAKVTHGLADLTVKSSHLVEKLTAYHPNVARYSQLMVLSVSKVMLMAGMGAGFLATSYPPIALIGLAITIASKGVELTSDILPTALEGVAKLGHLQAKLTDAAMGKVHGAADGLHHHADKLHEQALAATQMKIDGTGSLGAVLPGVPLDSAAVATPMLETPVLAMSAEEGSFMSSIGDGITTIAEEIVDGVQAVFSPAGLEVVDTALDHLGNTIEWTEDKVQDILTPIGHAFEVAGKPAIANGLKVAQGVVEKIDHVTDIVFPKIDQAMDKLEEHFAASNPEEVAAVPVQAVA